MAWGKIISVILAVIAFIVAWRLLDVLLGAASGTFGWGIKAILLLVLLYFVWRLFARRHRVPSWR